MRLVKNVRSTELPIVENLRQVRAIRQAVNGNRRRGVSRRVVCFFFRYQRRHDGREKEACIGVRQTHASDTRTAMRCECDALCVGIEHDDDARAPLATPTSQFGHDVRRFVVGFVDEPAFAADVDRWHGCARTMRRVGWRAVRIDDRHSRPRQEEKHTSTQHTFLAK